MRWLALLPAVLTAAAMAGGAGEALVALFAVPALLYAPGLGLARRACRDPLDRALLAFWASCVLAVPAVLIGAYTGLGGAGTLAAAATITAATARLAPQRGARLPFEARVGVVAVLVTTALVAASWRATILRPLDRHWWFAPAEGLWGDSDDEPRVTTPPPKGGGWSERRRVGWEDAGAERLVPRTGEPFFVGPAKGPALLVLRGPVGASIEADGKQAVVTADVTVSSDEGPVPRYLGSGVTALALELDLVPGERLQLRLSSPGRSVVYLLSSPEAVWSLHAVGELRFVHYYQLLNMVEQVRWARELYAERRVTDVQPPLPSYVLAAPLAVTSGELPTANLVFVLELAMVGLGGLAALRAFAPRAPLLAWLLPAGAVAMHAKLMLEPGSAMLPDTLYTLGVLGALAALPRPGPGFTAQALLAQLSRYPAAFVTSIAGILDGQLRRVVVMLATVVATAVAFAIGGLLTGSLDGWLATVWWEIGPEHWHGEHDPAVLLPRAPSFYWLWILYAGGLPLLAALRWPRGTRVLLGTALVYSLLLCTIDHSPSHYFLPLVHLAAVAAGCTAAASGPWLRSGIPILGLVGISVAYGFVPVVG